MVSSAGVGIFGRAVRAVIFDMDGVVTDTASVHAAAWKRLFDEYLRVRSERLGEPFRPFDIDEDYRRYVDGKPRYDGVASFLASRHIDEDPDTVRRLGDRKDSYFHAALARDGVRTYESTVALVGRLRVRRVGVAIVSASRSMTDVLAAAGLADTFDVRVDGVEAERLGLAGKPDPATFVEAARRLDVDPSQAAVVEDALAGVEAGRRGGFGLVIGVDRAGYADALRAAGADVVVADLHEIDLPTP